MDNLIPKSPKLYNCFYNEQTELNDTHLYKAQQQDAVKKQLLLWKHYEKYTSSPS